jgi:hypothetical protein
MELDGAVAFARPIGGSRFVRYARMSELGIWQPLKPDEVARTLAGLEAPWWIAGGWAIDVFLGRQSRAHGDIDVGVLRRDQLAVQAVLEDWDLPAAEPPGSLRPWLPGETLPEAVHDIWCRPNPDAAWGIQLMLDEADGDYWEYRRFAAITRRLESLVWRHSGTPYLVPEVQLLYKAGQLNPKNEQDFEACLPLFKEHQRTWLALALRLAHPGHPWIGRLTLGHSTAGGAV